MAQTTRTVLKARKDKAKVLDEVWDDARIKSFLNKAAPVQSGAALPGDADFFVLRNAYQAMRAEDFGRFLDFFAGEGGDVQARNGDGQTLAEFIAPHAKAGAFIELLNGH